MLQLRESLLGWLVSIILANVAGVLITWAPAPVLVHVSVIALAVWCYVVSAVIAALSSVVLYQWAKNGRD